ncbi:hypothetical protein ACROYT_G030941 [Oculina patagonica]
MAFDQSISWFQQKLGKYDKASWERTFEEQEQETGFIHVPKKPGGLKPELIDVDLVIGSTFPKTKPVHTWFAVTQKGLIRVLLFPFFRSWWSQQLSPKLWFLFLFLYLCEVLVLVIYLREWEKHWKVVTWSEACGPALIMLLLGVLYMYMVSTDYSSSSQRRKAKTINRRRRAVRQKRKSSGQENGGTVQHDTLTNGIRQRKPQQQTNSGPDSNNKDTVEGVENMDQYNAKDNDNDKTEEELSESGETTSSTTESEVSDVEMDSNNEDPFAWDKQTNGSPGLDTSPTPPPTAEKVMVSIWEGNQCKKAQLTLMEISAAIANKVDTHKSHTGYVQFSVVVSVLLAFIPLLFRLYNTTGNIGNLLTNNTEDLLCKMFGYSMWSRVIIVISMLERFFLCFSFFFLLCVAEKSYRERCLYAKLFGWLTSSRKSRRAGLPHFRLHKVRNIKTWLSLRSLLKRRGPQRSVDMIVSSSFILGMILVILMCVQLIKGTEKERFLSILFNWEVSIWCLVLSVYVLRFMTLGSKINSKFTNTSGLLTEQINLYLQMEKAPHKKEDLTIANHVLKLASKLLKEIESPFKMSGLSMNPLLYNITRVVVLSLFSGVMSDLLGFRLKVWKIKT